MRPVLLASAVLCTAFVLAPSARAQQGPGWVDPPAKSGEANKPRPPEKAEAAKPAPAKPAPVARSEAPEEAQGEPAPSAAPRRPARARAAEVRRARRLAAREAAPHRPAAAPVFTPQRAEAPDRVPADPRRLSEWAGTAQRLSLDYLDSVSRPGATMVAETPRFYGEAVRFYGRTLSLSALMAEKRRFVRRWPERRYETQGEPQVACNAAGALCQVRSTYAFTAASPARGTRSQGVAELVLTVSFSGPRPVIVAETSRVLRRGALTASTGGRGGA